MIRIQGARHGSPGTFAECTRGGGRHLRLSVDSLAMSLRGVDISHFAFHKQTAVSLAGYFCPHRIYSMLYAIF